MKLYILGALASLCVATLALNTNENNKVVCYWNSTSFNRPGISRFVIDDLRPALVMCTHLIYGFAGINAESNEVVPLNPDLDTNPGGQNFYRLVTQLKTSFPNVEFLLGIGGGADPDETHKYVTSLETTESRTKLVDSIGNLLDQYGFGGVDLAWQFPEVKIPKKRGILKSWWHAFKKRIGAGKWQDDKEAEHRDGFTAFVRELRERKMRSKTITVSVLPHVNASVYYDVSGLRPLLNAVHVLAFDQRNPRRNPKEADYPAPIFKNQGRIPEENIDAAIRYWLENSFLGSRIVVGIPTFGRTWKLTADSNITGVPPLTVDGPGPAGPYTGIPGLLSYPEICARLALGAEGHLTHVRDTLKKYGSYAYQSYNAETGADGIWVGYEDWDTAANKASYVKARGLGGVAIFDISLDDFQGICTGYKYPIIRTAKSVL